MAHHGVWVQPNKRVPKVTDLDSRQLLCASTSAQIDNAVALGETASTVKSRLSHILSFYLQAITTYLESLLSEIATAGPGAHKMDLCDCALELQEAFDSDKEYQLGSLILRRN